MLASRFWNVFMTKTPQSLNTSDRLKRIIGNIYLWWFSFCFSIISSLFFCSRTSTVAISGVWNATSVPKPLWGLNDSNFTTSERPTQTNKSKGVMLYLSQSMLSSSSLFLRAHNTYQKAVCMCIGSLVLCLGCVLQESKDLACLVACCILNTQHNALFNKCLLNKLMYESIIYKELLEMNA